MSDQTDPSFDSIESAQEFVDLLAQAVEETRQEIQAQIDELPASGSERRLQALRLVAFKLDSLSTNMAGSRRLLNDLRTLRRLLLEERHAG